MKKLAMLLVFVLTMSAVVPVTTKAACRVKYEDHSITVWEDGARTYVIATKDYVKDGYEVGLTVDSKNVMTTDSNKVMIIQSEDDCLCTGWYVAYNLKTGNYYYLDSETAFNYIDSQK